MSDEQDKQNDAAVQKPEAPTPIVARTPSSESVTPRPEAKAAEAPSLADAVRTLITFVKAHRTAGDSDLEAAVADVEAALASWGT